MIRKASPKQSRKSILIIVVLTLLIGLSHFFFSYNGTFNLSDPSQYENMKVRLTQGNIQISHSSTGELSGAYSSGLLPAFYTKSLKFYALQGNFQAAIPSNSDFKIDIHTLQGSLVIDTGETNISSTKLNVGQGNILIVPSNRISSTHDISIKQGNLTIIVPYGVDGLRLNTQGKKLTELDKAENYSYINGGYQSAGFDDSAIKAVLNLSGSPRVTSIKLFNEEETRKAYFVE
jgi:hypothetical protein